MKQLSSGMLSVFTLNLCLIRIQLVKVYLFLQSEDMMRIQELFSLSFILSPLCSDTDAV